MKLQARDVRASRGKEGPGIGFGGVAAGRAVIVAAVCVERVASNGQDFAVCQRRAEDIRVGRADSLEAALLGIEQARIIEILRIALMFCATLCSLPPNVNTSSGWQQCS